MTAALGEGSKASATSGGRPSAVPATESDLIAGLCRGEEAAYLSLIQRHSASMLRIAKLYVASHATAEDVVQETFVAVWNGVSRFEKRSSLKTWMFQILTNRARTAGRVERRCIPNTGLALRGVEGPRADSSRRSRGNLPPPRPMPWTIPQQPWGRTAEDRLVAAEAATFIHLAIKNLPPAQRLVISLRDVDSWTAAEVCQLLDISSNHQRVLLHRARVTLRQQLERFYMNEMADASR